MSLFAYWFVTCIFCFSSLGMLFWTRSWCRHCMYIVQSIMYMLYVDESKGRDTQKRETNMKKLHVDKTKQAISDYTHLCCILRCMEKVHLGSSVFKITCQSYSIWLDAGMTRGIQWFLNNIHSMKKERGININNAAYWAETDYMYTHKVLSWVTLPVLETYAQQVQLHRQYVRFMFQRCIFSYEPRQWHEPCWSILCTLCTVARTLHMSFEHSSRWQED